MNVEHIIQAAEEYSEQHFRDGEIDRTERLAYEVVVLRSKLREFAYLIQQQKDTIETLHEKLQKKAG